ncbi:peptidoglycan-binding protein [Nostocoides sp. F2B08]|uniref:peptidoglycan-binding domain-containing protein n=1 Tax=Nostocoides sp. F2B08 TaxID=2653936 RepID=UPI00186AC94C|nr:peptidoglycan-binding protein [Tetrasphaera sp. F2B08]
MSALSAPLVAAPLLATGTAQAVPSLAAFTVPAPPTPKVTLPAEVDIAPSYQGQNTCDPTAKPGPIALAQLLNSHYGSRSYGISRSCGNGVTEHSEGRALDWMINANVPEQKAIADAVVQWLSAGDDKGNAGVMARRLGIMYIIWDRKVWRAYAPERGWAAYTGSSPHTDHIHFSFTWDGAYMRTSWWTGVALKTVTIGAGSGVPGAPPPGSVPVLTSTGYYVLRVGSFGDEVKLVQRALQIPDDGAFGPVTFEAVRAYQSRKGLTADGIVGNETWNRLIADGLVPAKTAAAHPLEQYARSTLRLGSRGEGVAALQRAIGGVEADGVFGAVTEARVKAFQQTKELTADGVVTPNVWNALMGEPYTKTAPVAAAHPLQQYASTTLRVGSRGAAVTALQKALGGLTADGVFGPMTESKVKSYQRSKELKADGIVNANVWNALMGKSYTKTAPSTAPSPAPPPPPAATHPLEQHATVTVQRGSRGAAVAALQKALGGLTADGVFGALTEAKVRSYQQSKQLTVNGVVNANVWNALMGKTYTKTAVAAPAPAPSSSLSQYSSVVLRLGSRGDAVVALQKALGGLTADGVFGPATDKRVRDFQRSEELTVDGVVGRQTWAALIGS